MKFMLHGIEIEYMIVDKDSLDVRPIADRILRKLAGGTMCNEARMGRLCWSNELALHVLEVKTADPVEDILAMAPVFQGQIRALNKVVASERACLMPTGMHPWMDPLRESRLWPHADREIYDAFDRLFDCRGHGWTNLQSSHLNLPFSHEESFLALYHATRLALPLLPAISASSPCMNGEPTGRLDNRLDEYRGNCSRIPSITGRVVPEAVTSIDDYQRRVLDTMYQELAKIDSSGELEHEWLNARGAIARFERNTIEVRVLDCQENPGADIALQSVVETLIRHLISTTSIERMASVPQDALVALFEEAIDQGVGASVGTEILEVLGLPRSGATLLDVWRQLASGPFLAGLPAPARAYLELLLAEGCLSSRILQALGLRPSRDRLFEVYRRLTSCLDQGRMFSP
jgi:glutamate---cysteine ligase / carboxylate-amine ligase